MVRLIRRFDIEKIKYILWALSRVTDRDRACPSCGSWQTRLIRRKVLVTSLWECDACGLRFRAPKERADQAYKFYQSAYRSGFTTDCPTDPELAWLLANEFRASPKDYSTYIQVLRAIGLKPGDTILDFGCSWGYGSWQLRRAGFQVYSYEVSAPRAQFARVKLNCAIVNDLAAIPERVRCLFNAHVIEHLDDPNELWRAAAQVLDPHGMVICFMPNGEPNLERVYGTKRYDKLWGKVHPLLLTGRALRSMALRYGFSPFVYSAPYPLEKISAFQPTDNLPGSELLLIAVHDAVFPAQPPKR